MCAHWRDDREHRMLHSQKGEAQVKAEQGIYDLMMMLGW